MNLKNLLVLLPSLTLTFFMIYKLFNTTKSKDTIFNIFTEEIINELEEIKYTYYKKFFDDHTKSSDDKFNELTNIYENTSKLLKYDLETFFQLITDVFKKNIKSNEFKEYILINKTKYFIYEIEYLIQEKFFILKSIFYDIKISLEYIESNKNININDKSNELINGLIRNKKKTEEYLFIL